MEGTLWAFTHTYKNSEYTYTLIYKSIILWAYMFQMKWMSFSNISLKSIPGYLWIFSP